MFSARWSPALGDARAHPRYYTTLFADAVTNLLPDLRGGVRLLAQTRAAAADSIPNVARGLTVQRCVAAAVPRPSSVT